MDQPVDIPLAAWKAIERLFEACEGREEEQHLKSIIQYKDLKLTWKHLDKSLTEDQWLLLLGSFISLPLTLNTGSSWAIKEAREVVDDITNHACSLRDSIKQLCLLSDNNALRLNPILYDLSALIEESSKGNNDFLSWQERTANTARPRFPQPGDVELKYQPKPTDALNELAQQGHSGGLLPDDEVLAAQSKSCALIDWVRHYDQAFEDQGIDRDFPNGWKIGPSDLSRFLTAVSTKGKPKLDKNGSVIGGVSISTVNNARRGLKN